MSRNTEADAARGLDWPVLDLGRAAFDLWNPFAARVRAPDGRLSQAEHIREFGEPYGNNGA